jgi:hypothetical protein
MAAPIEIIPFSGVTGVTGVTHRITRWQERAISVMSGNTVANFRCYLCYGVDVPEFFAPGYFRP